MITGEVFTRKFGKGSAPKPGFTTVLIVGLLAVPDSEEGKVPSEMLSLTAAQITDAGRLALAIDIPNAHAPAENTAGYGIDTIVTRPIWRC